MRHGTLEAIRNLIRHTVAELCGKGGSSLADQIGLYDARKKWCEACDAAFLGQTTGNPVDPLIAGKRRRCRLRIGSLAVVDKDDLASSADRLHAMLQAGEALEALTDLLLRHTDCEAGRNGRTGVLGVVTAAQRLNAVEIDEKRGRPLFGPHDARAFGIEPVGERLPLRDPDDPGPGALDTIADQFAMAVISADDRSPGTGNETLLHVRIVLHRTMTIEMVGRQVEQDSGSRVQRRGKIDLVGRAFDHIEPPIPGRIERQNGPADIATKLRIATTCFEDMGNQCRGGRFAVGPGDRDERAIRRMSSPLPHEDLDVADDLDTGIAGKADRPVRFRMGERHTGRQHEGCDRRPVDLPQVPCRHALGLCPRDAVGIVVPGNHSRTAGLKRLGRGKTGTAEPEQRNSLPLEGGGRDHRRLTAASGSKDRAWQAQRQ